MAELHHKPDQHVTAVSIEHTPWGQHLQAESIRLVSCTTAGKVSMLPSGTRQQLCDLLNVKAKYQNPTAEWAIAASVSWT